MRDSNLDSIGASFYKDTNNKNQIIEKIKYDAEKKELFINSSLYFSNVSQAIWEYKIGGYAVLDKYLKSHKEEKLDFEYFTKIIQTLHKSLEVESQIAEIDLWHN